MPRNSPIVLISDTRSWLRPYSWTRHALPARPTGPRFAHVIPHHCRAVPDRFLCFWKSPGVLSVPREPGDSGWASGGRGDARAGHRSSSCGTGLHLTQKRKAGPARNKPRKPRIRKKPSTASQREDGWWLSGDEAMGTRESIARSRQVRRSLPSSRGASSATFASTTRSKSPRRSTRPRASSRRLINAPALGLD